MPFGVSGTGVEVYTARVWIVNGAVVFFTAPGSVADFTSTNGGGFFTSVDSFLRVGYTAARSANGFLYLLGDSSTNYISGVTTSAATSTSLPVTNFTNQNSDPEIGTPYPGSVDVLGRNLVFANDWGVHVAYGNQVSKVSHDLNGVYNTVPSFGGFQLTAIQVHHFRPQGLDDPGADR